MIFFIPQVILSSSLTPMTLERLEQMSSCSIICIIQEMNEPVMVIQTALFTCDYNCRVVQVLTALLQIIIIPFILIEPFIFIETDLHLRSLSDCKQPSLWPLLHQKLYHCVLFLNFTLILRQPQQIVSKCFLQVFKGFKYYILTSYFR